MVILYTLFSSIA